MRTSARCSEKNTLLAHSCPRVRDKCMPDFYRHNGLISQAKFLSEMRKFSREIIAHMRDEDKCDSVAEKEFASPTSRSS